MFGFVVRGPEVCGRVGLGAVAVSTSISAHFGWIESVIGEDYNVSISAEQEGFWVNKLQDAGGTKGGGKGRVVWVWDTFERDLIFLILLFLHK